MFVYVSSTEPPWTFPTNDSIFNNVIGELCFGEDKTATGEDEENGETDSGQEESANSDDTQVLIIGRGGLSFDKKETIWVSEVARRDRSNLTLSFVSVGLSQSTSFFDVLIRL